MILSNLTFHRILSSLRRAFATGETFWQASLTPSHTWPHSIWDLQIIYLLRLVFSNIRCVFRTLNFDHWSVHLFISFYLPSIVL